MLEDVSDCLDRALANRGRDCRVNLAEMPAGAIKALAVPCEQRAKKVVDFINGRIPPHKRQQIHIIFCEDRRYGTFAICEQYNFIVLKTGTILRLLYFCECMMDKPELWPNIRSEAIQAFSVVLTFQCFDLIVLHELAHLLLGHLDEDAQEAKGNPMVSQALEFVADGHAAIWGFEALRTLENYGHHDAAADGLREFHRTPTDALTNLLLTLFFMFRIGDEKTPTEGELANAGHARADAI